MLSWLIGTRPREVARRSRPRLGHARWLQLESLETRRMLSVAPIADWTIAAAQELSTTVPTSHKPQSKVWENDNAWWSVIPNGSGTHLYKLTGNAWQQQLQLTTETEIQADVKSLGNLAHVLLFDGPQSQLATLEYSSTLGVYQWWSARAGLVDIGLDNGVETATIDVDSTGRMWLASDGTSQINVRYSDGLYDSWSAPITLADNVSSDDIAVITAMPNNRMGVFWSNQTTERFGFRIHLDGTAPELWTTDEVPASQSALNLGHGMADDHVNVAVTSDGTLYAAVKTGYDTSGQPLIALLVRRANGSWDDLYEVDSDGTRPIVVVNESANRVVVMYTETKGGGRIVMRESPLGQISFGAKKVVISQSTNDVTAPKHVFSDELVVMAGGSTTVYSVRMTSPTSPGPVTTNTNVTRTFRDGVTPSSSYSGTRDTWIRATSPTRRSGSSSSLTIDGSPDSAALLKWDISSIPTGSVVTGASITLQVTSGTVDGYEIYELLRNWSESDATWLQATAGGSWQVAGAQGASDRGNAVLGVLSSPSTGSVTLSLNAAGLAVVQRWINDPSSNFGVVLQDYVNASDAATFRSRETSTSGQRPQLRVDYSTGPVGPVVNQAPVVDAGAPQIAQVGQLVILAGLVTDDGLPSPPQGITTLWSVQSGPSPVVFGDAAARTTGATFSTVGTYVLQLTAFDGALTTIDTVTITIQAASASTLDQGLAAHWRMDQLVGPQLTDASTLANHALVTGNPQVTTGRVNAALAFDGNDFANAPHHSSLNVGQQLTLSTWIRPGKVDTQYLITKSVKDQVDGFELSLSSTGTMFVRFNQATSANAFRVDSLTKYTANASQWIHLAATYDGQFIRLFVNGVQEASLQANFTMAQNTRNLFLGSGDSGYRPYQGGMDDVRIYNRALTAADIQSLATQA